jgi:hypothetical protein
MRVASRQGTTRLPYPGPPSPRCTKGGVEFFEKYRLQNVGTTRARLAELITIFETERQTMTIRELEDLRAEIDQLTEKLRVERDGL